MSERVPDAREVRVLLTLHRPGEAVEMALRLVADDPNDAEARVLAAQALLDAGRRVEAFEHAKRAIALDPQRSDAFAALSLANGDLGHRRHATACARKAVELDPMNPNRHAILVEALVHQCGTLRARSAERNALLGEMNRHADITLELAPDTALAHLMKAKATLARGRPAMARIEAKKALEIDPDNAVAHQILGLAAQQEGEASKASDHFLAAAKVDHPGSGHSLRLLRRLRVGPAWRFGYVFAAWLAVRVLLGLATTGGPGLAVAVVLALAIVAVIAVFWYRTRRAHSPEAREVLKRDRKLRRGVKRL
jgi:tetratricopeptide (TPR) repeat protein